MEESTIFRCSDSQKDPLQFDSHSHNPEHQSKAKRRPGAFVFHSAAIGLVLITLLTACGPTSEELAAFQTVTAIAAFTPTPQPTPTLAGITPGEDLTAILVAADDGDLITLAPGVFNLPQGLNLNKSLTLVGAGDDQTILTTTTPYADITTMLMFSGTGTLTFKGIKIEYAGSAPAAVLYMQSGNLVLEDCTLTGATLSSSGKQLGVLSMANDATAVIRNSHITGSLNRIDAENPQKIPGGIFLAGTNKLTIGESSITDSYIGIYAYGQADVMVSGSELSNSYAALTLLETATATISGSTFANCSGSCIVTLDDAHASISDNIFTDSPNGLAIQITENSNAQMSNNRLSNVKSAILFMDNAIGEATGNTIEDFTNIGIVVQNTAAPILSNNILSLGSGPSENTIGISYQDSATGEARGNQFSNLYLGISVKDKATPQLNSNTLDACYTGIAYSGDAAGTALANIIQNGETGILIEAPASPVITNNTIQAYSFGLRTEPEDWIRQLKVSDNAITEGAPVIVIMTVTPKP